MITLRKIASSILLRTPVLASASLRNRFFSAATPVSSEKEQVPAIKTKGHKPNGGLDNDSIKFYQASKEEFPKPGKLLGKPGDPSYGARYLIDDSEPEVTQEWKQDKNTGMFYQGKTLEEVSKSKASQKPDIDTAADDMVGYCSPSKK